MEADLTIGVAQSKILNFDRRHIQTVGDLFDPTLNVYLIGSNEKDNGQYDRMCEISFACGAALIVRRSLIERIGLFDPNFFWYHDDSDLSWRARLAGFKVVSVPSSIVYHKGRGTSAHTLKRKQEILFYLTSRCGLFIKNLEGKNLLKLGGILFTSISMDIFGLLLQGNVKTPIKFLSWAFKNLRYNWKKRLVVQNQTRKVSDNEVFKFFLDSSIFVLRIKRHFDRLVGGGLYRDFKKYVNQETYNYYKNHLYNR